MNGFLVDTNVVSELTRQVPNPQVLSFLVEKEELWISSIVLHELNLGVELLPLRSQRDRIHSALSDFIAQYSDRIVPVGDSEAVQAAFFRAQMHRIGRFLDLGDALIAGTAKVNNLSVATRNIRDFEHLAIDVVNPWD